MHFLKRILKTHFRALNFRLWRRYEKSTNFEALTKVSSYYNISLTHLWQLHSDSELFVFTKFRSLSKLSTFIGCLHPASNPLICIDINCLLTSLRIHVGLGVVLSSLILRQEATSPPTTPAQNACTSPPGCATRTGNSRLLRPGSFAWSCSS